MAWILASVTAAPQGSRQRAYESFEWIPTAVSPCAGTMRLGEATDSYDADGNVCETADWEHVTDEHLNSTAQEQFVGDIQQLPPMFSAIRVKGALQKVSQLAVR